MKNAVFLDTVSCRSCKNRCFEGTCRLRLQGSENERARKVLNYLSVSKRQTLFSLVHLLYPEDGGIMFLIT
jgi:hypothetical protein